MIKFCITLGFSFYFYVYPSIAANIFRVWFAFNIFLIEISFNFNEKLSYYSLTK